MKVLVAAAMMLAAMPAAEAAGFAGVWNGYYDCDGITRQMQIELLPAGGNAYSGMFTFFGGEILGRFAIRAATSPDGTLLVAEPSGWVDHPEGYAMVGFMGRIADDVMFGRMSSQQCGAFFAELDADAVR